MPESPKRFFSIRPKPIIVQADPRGGLWKVLSSGDLKENQPFGEIYLVSLKKNAVRGNHYHEKTTEWFLPVQGRISCHVALPGTSFCSRFLLDASKPEVIQVPPGIAHAFSSEVDVSAKLLAYADQEYDADHPDSVFYDCGLKGVGGVHSE
jgi:dTDP-4-dehydrorhamnose 3,5-epimerase